VVAPTQYGDTEIITDASVRNYAVSESMLANFLTVIPHTVAAAGADEFLDPSASLVLNPSNDGLSQHRPFRNGLVGVFVAPLADHIGGSWIPKLSTTRDLRRQADLSACSPSGTRSPSEPCTPRRCRPTITRFRLSE
jgi:hypothetical protein